MEDLDKLLAEIREEPPGYTQTDIDSFSLSGKRLPGSLVGSKSGDLDLTNFGSRMATGRKRATKPPTEVELEYFKRVETDVASGKKPPYLLYEGKRWYYNRGGKKGTDGIKDLSLRSLSNKLKLESKYADTRDAQTPTVADYEKAFPGKGKELHKQELNRRKLQVKTQKDAIKRTGVNFDLDHIRPNMNEGRTHSRNFRLMNSSRNRLEQNRRPLSDTQLTQLKQNATNNVDYLKTQGPDMTPRQRQAIIQGKPNVSRLNIKGGSAMFSQGIGGLLGFLSNQKALDAAAKGDAETAITEGAADFVKGEAISQVAQRTVIPAVQKVLPSFVGGLAKIAPLFTSLSVGATIGQVMKDNLDVNTSTSGRGEGRKALSGT